MTTHLHLLKGCAPAPLAHYLKALGILRILAEQADTQVRGCWRDEHFCLLTSLDRKQLEAFFLERYAPTPFVSPWNKGSGFFQQNDPGMAPIESSTSERFADFRAGIAAGRDQLSALEMADAEIRRLKDSTKVRKGMSSAESAAARTLKNDADFKATLATANKRFAILKADLFTPCQLAWRGPHRTWMDAALVVAEAGKPSFPSLLGTGGNDGRLDFTNNAMQRLNELFDLGDEACKPREGTAGLLCDAIWSEPANCLSNNAIGQFLPSGAGGANSTTAADGSSLINPWDFILMLEGAVLFSARTTRRLDPRSSSRASAPFVLRAHAAGHASSGDEKAERGEQWMPLWSRLTTFRELRAMLGEARLQLGRQTANRPIDAARAIARLGVARGISAFTRYGYLERNGQSNLAVALDRIPVRERPRARLIDDLAPWLDRVQRQARDKNAPARLVHVERRLADAVLAALTHDDAPDRWQAVLRAAVAVEMIQKSGTAIDCRPIPPIRPEWILATCDNSAEHRLAMALGSAGSPTTRRRGPIDPVRHHWLPLDRFARDFNKHDKKLAHDPRVVITGRDATGDMAAMVERRFIDSGMSGENARRLPLIAFSDCSADLSDLADLIAGHIDLVRVSELARAFMAVNWARLDKTHLPERSLSRRTTDKFRLDEGWLAVRLACLPWPLVEGSHDIRAEPAMIRRLVAGDGPGAVEIALRRLRASGLRAPLQSAFIDADTARLWAAALAFPISNRDALRAATAFDPNFSRRAS